MASNWNPGFLGPPLWLAQAGGPRTPSPTPSKQSGPVFKIEDTPALTPLQRFEASIKDFQEALAALPPQHKAEIRTIHQAVETWADKEHAAGRKADKLSSFTGRVMEYCNQALSSIERSDPDLTRRKQEHEQLNKVFYKGQALIDAYAAYVKDKSDP